MNTPHETSHQHHDGCGCQSTDSEAATLALLKQHAHPGCTQCKGTGFKPKTVKDGHGKKSKWIRIRIPCICATLSIQQEALRAESKKAEALSEEMHVTPGTNQHEKSVPAFTFRPVANVADAA
jgi:hypothetical protein